MTQGGKGKEGELSPEQAVIAKNIFIGFGFLALAIIIYVMDTFVPIAYVVASLIITGLVIVARSEIVASRKRISSQ